MKGSVFVQKRTRTGNLGPVNPMSFLVPLSLMDVFEEGKRQHDGCVRAYLKSLLRKYRPLFNHGLLPSSDGDRCSREYQKRLAEPRKKITFRPNGSDWGEISNVALSHGLSVCRFFTLLLTLEAVGCGGEEIQKLIHVGIPTMLCVTSTLTQQIRQADGVYERSYHQTQYPHPALSPQVTYYPTEFG